jgi:hypothetical protein
MSAKKKKEIIKLCEQLALTTISSKVLAPSAQHDENCSTISALLFGNKPLATWKFVRNSETQMKERAADPMIKNLIDRIRKASDLGDAALTKTFLSLCYPFFTRNGMCKNFGIQVNERVWRSTHTEHLTGLQDINKSIGFTTKRRLEIVDKNMIQSAITFVLDKQVNLVASGTHFVPYSNGTLEHLPRCLRKYSIKQCYAEFMYHFPDSKARFSQSLFEYLLKTIAPKESSLHVAVDPVLVKCNLKFFIEIRRLIDYITRDQTPELKNFLLDLTQQLQDHLQYSLWNHLEEKGKVSTTPCHNLSNLCSLPGERVVIDEAHTACKECDNIYLLFEELLDATDTMPYRQKPLIPVPIDSEYECHPLDRNTKESLKGYITDVLQKNAFT